MRAALAAQGLTDRSDDDVGQMMLLEKSGRRHTHPSWPPKAMEVSDGSCRHLQLG